jgi:hypothetical protein
VDVGLIVAEFGKVSGFSAGSGAQVKDVFAGFGVKKDCGVLGGFILDAPESLSVAWQAFWWSGMTEMEAVFEGADFRAAAGGFEELAELVAGSAELIDAEGGLRGFVEEEAGVDLFIIGECAGPAFGECVGE